ncbi:MAG: tetratricopeptide repeat protein [Archangium sp.]|nr:tetratricopeptide repeat protein [Archangium sp.]
MRTLVLVSCVVSVVAVAAPPERRPVVAFLPASGKTPELSALGWLIEARASELLESTGQYAEIHVKQALAMTSHEGLSLDTPAAAESARVLLGADRAVAISIDEAGKGLSLTGTLAVAGGAPTSFSVAALPAAWSQALTQGSEAVAKAVLALDKRALPKKSAQPESKSNDALTALGSCYGTAMRQSLAVDAPVLFVGEELDAATEDCRKAFAADKGLKYAQATQALLQAVVGDDAEASATLKALGAGDGLETATLARFWLVTRYQSNDAGVAVLRDAVKKTPGALILHAYLAETLATLGQHDKAVEALNAFLAIAPSSPWAHGRLSRALARQGKHDDAIAAAAKGLELAPSSKEARLQLASRYIDAGKLDEAVSALKPLTDTADASGEAMGRLGWAYWLKGNVDEAAKGFQASLDRSTNPGDWRTRGRALYNLAMVEAKRGKLEMAKINYKASLSTGFKVATVDPVLTPVVNALSGDAGAVAVAIPADRPKENSLFPTDASGAVDPTAKKPAAPAGLPPAKK